MFYIISNVFHSGFIASFVNVTSPSIGVIMNVSVAFLLGLENMFFSSILYDITEMKVCRISGKFRYVVSILIGIASCFSCYNLHLSLANKSPKMLLLKIT